MFAAITGALAAMGGWAIAAQDKYTVKVPNGLAFSEFKGYEDWQAVGPSQTDAQNVMRLILANPVMIQRIQGRRSRQRQALPGGLEDRED